MPRSQFSIRTLLWLALVVAVFFCGMRFGREITQRDLEGAYFECYRWPAAVEPAELAPPE